MMDNTSISYLSQLATTGMVSHSATIIQSEGSVGGTRYVFEQLEALIKNAFVHPPIGGKLVNPFKGPAKIYAGDLIEHDLGFSAGDDGPGATIKILKAYAVAKAATNTDTTIYIVRNGFVHVPFVGDNIMVGQKTFATKSVGVTVTAVEATTDATAGDVWKLTLSKTLGVALKVDDVLVEAASAGDGVLPMVTNPNCFAPCDNDLPFYDAGGDKYHKPRTNINFCMLNPDCVMWLNRMGPVPPAVKAMNKSLYPEFWHI